MKNVIISLVALITGFITLMFAAVVGLFATATAIIARPFLRRKLAKMRVQSQYENHGQVIEGEFTDISAKS